jgi:predicted RNA-binding Zn ribbon-like protein
MPETAKRPAQEPPIPAVAVAIVDLLNSRKHSIHSDKFDDPGLAKQVLAPFGQGPDEVSPQRLDLVRAVRSDLLSLVEGRDQEDGARHWAAFTGRTSDVAYRQDFTEPGQVRLRQVAGDPVLGAIGLAVAELVEANTWSRLRICANDVCQGAFYDTTRSRTRRWHSYEICGNRTNVAAYRARNAEVTR